MAEEVGKQSKGARFLKKSKWGKLFKEDTSGAPDRQGTFTLNDDVADFLKPSADRQVPKLNISIAQRWPNAHEVLAAEGASPQPQSMGSGKPKRRKNLTVGFVETEPEVIGEGGDESLEPTMEISRRKHSVPRSHSGATAQVKGTGTRSEPQGLRLVSDGDDDSDGAAESNFQPLRRAQNSQHEASPPLQQTGHSFSSKDSLPYQQPSGSSRLQVSDDQSENMSSQRPDNSQPLNVEDGPGYRGQGLGAPAKKQYLGLAPRNTDSPVARKSRDMSLSEGMAFRRVSSMIIPDDDDDDNDMRYQSIMSGQSPTSYPQQSVSSTRLTVPQVVPPQDQKLVHDTSTSLPDPNPFDDPKYMKRHSRETFPSSMQQAYVPLSALSQGEKLLANPQTTEQVSQENTRWRSQPASPPAPQAQRHDRPTPNFSRPPPSSYQQNQLAYNGSQPQPLQNYARGNAPPAARQMQDTDSNRGRTASQSDTNRQEASGYSRASNDPYTQPIPQTGQLALPDRSRQPRDNGQPEISQPTSYLTNAKPAPGPRQSSSSSSQNIPVPQFASRGSSLSPNPTRPDNSSLQSDPTRPIMSRPNGSSPNINHFPAPSSDSRGNQQEGAPIAQPIPSSMFVNRSGAQKQSPQLTQAAFTRPTPSPMAPGVRQSSGDSSTAVRTQMQPSGKSLAGSLRQDEALRPDSSESSRSTTRLPLSPQIGVSPSMESNPAADSAYSDFASRVAHMKGVFRLTAEKEIPADRCTPESWLRAGLWWYIKGKAGLELLAHRRPQSPNGQPREMLTQAHVDLAKAWWIISSVLAAFHPPEQGSPRPADPAAPLGQSILILRAHLKSLSLSMGKSNLMPPTQSLIQGQDTRIWLNYPQFTADTTAVLSTDTSKSATVDQPKPQTDPFDMLPLSDTENHFFYGRYPVEVYLNTDEAATDRVLLPCTMSVLRNRREYQMGLVLASQNDLVNVRVNDSPAEKRGLTWQDVSWKPNHFCLLIHLSRDVDITVRMQERDFRAIWNLTEYARNIDRSTQAEQGEKLVHESHLVELQYADSSNTSSFPTEKIRGGVALIFERCITHRDASRTRRMHRGYRLLLLTDPGMKALSNVSHDICRNAPLYFEFLTDAAAHGATAMIIRVREESKQCRILLVFPDAATRQAVHDVLSGLSIGPEERILGKLAVQHLDIAPASQSVGFSATPSAMQGLQWQRLYVSNNRPEDPNSRIPDTIGSENLRVIARHAAGCITDRLNLDKGEMLFRLPCTDAPTMQILRRPQADLSMSIETKNSPPSVVDGLEKLLQVAQSEPTCRTFTFNAANDLHAFQSYITGFTVRYDGLASTFGIQRRLAVVAIHKKWEATNVRLQVVSKEPVVQVLAFMEDFSHADAMCFQVKSTDTVESIKGDGRHKKWAVRLVDAKFSLPKQEKGEMDPEERLQRRFINLEGFDYAEEHDDLTIGFDTEEGEFVDRA